MKNTLQIAGESLYTGTGYLFLFLSTADEKDMVNITNIVILLIFAFVACYGTMKLLRRRKAK